MATAFERFRLRRPSRMGMRTQRSAKRSRITGSIPELSRPNSRKASALYATSA